MRTTTHTHTTSIYPLHEYACVHTHTHTQIASSSLADPLSPTLQTSTSVHSGRGGRSLGSLSYSEYRPDAQNSFQALTVHSGLSQRWHVQQRQCAFQDKVCGWCFYSDTVSLNCMSYYYIVNGIVIEHVQSY